MKKTLYLAVEVDAPEDSDPTLQLNDVAMWAESRLSDTDVKATVTAYASANDLISDEAVQSATNAAAVQRIPPQTIRVSQTYVGYSLRINAPEFFQDKAFVTWLNNKERKFTWHQGGTPGEYADTVILVDPGLTGEGSDDDMPEHIWSKIISVCTKVFSGVVSHPDEVITVRLTNLENEPSDVVGDTQAAAESGSPSDSAAAMVRRGVGNKLTFVSGHMRLRAMLALSGKATVVEVGTGKKIEVVMKDGQIVALEDDDQLQAVPGLTNEPDITGALWANFASLENQLTELLQGRPDAVVILGQDAWSLRAQDDDLELHHAIYADGEFGDWETRAEFALDWVDVNDADLQQGNDAMQRAIDTFDACVTTFAALAQAKAASTAAS